MILIIIIVLVVLVTIWWLHHHDPEDIVRFSGIKVNDKYETTLKLHRKDIDLEVARFFHLKEGNFRKFHPTERISHKIYVKYLGRLTQNSHNFPTLHKIARHDDISCLYFKKNKVTIRTFGGKFDKIFCEIAGSTSAAKNIVDNI